MKPTLTVYTLRRRADPRSGDTHGTRTSHSGVAGSDIPGMFTHSLEEATELSQALDLQIVQHTYALQSSDVVAYWQGGVPVALSDRALLPQQRAPMPHQCPHCFWYPTTPNDPAGLLALHVDLAHTSVGPEDES